jgi:2,3-bisphosphoglycerate-dependent phosphoglycerate mutase
MEAVRPKRKVRIRILPVLGYIVVVLGLAWFFELQDTTTFIFVRHAETEGAPGDPDPPLSARGRQRAELLADFLADVDVVRSVDAIYATTARRTQQTAAPLAKRLNYTLNIDDPYLVERFGRRLLRDRRGKITLIVIDADAIAPMIDELHGSKRLPAFGPADFGEIYFVTVPYYGRVKTYRFHYGDPPSEASLSEGAATTFSAAPASPETPPSVPAAQLSPPAAPPAP